MACPIWWGKRGYRERYPKNFSRPARKKQLSGAGFPHISFPMPDGECRGSSRECGF